MEKKIIYFILLFCFNATFAQTKIFEGVITYKHQAFINGSQQHYLPIETEEVYYNERYLLTKVLRGRALSLTGNRDILLDSKRFMRFQIDHNRQTFSELDSTKLDEFEQLTETHQLKVDTILGHKCAVYKFKYLKKAETIGPAGIDVRIDTLECLYYISTEMKLNKPELFARLQGYRNTKLLDGRFVGIPLKIITTNSNGFRLVIEAVNIEERKIDDFVRTPDNYTKVKL